MPTVQLPDGSEVRIDEVKYAVDVKKTVQYRLGHPTFLQMLYLDGSESELKASDPVDEDALMHLVLRPFQLNECADSIASHYMSANSSEDHAESDCTRKLLLIGNRGAGKESLWHRICDGTYTDNDTFLRGEGDLGGFLVAPKLVYCVRDGTTLASMAIPEFRLTADGGARQDPDTLARMINIKTEVWNMPRNHDRIGNTGSYLRSYLRHVQCVIGVFAITNAESFSDLKDHWKQRVDEEAPPGTPLVLVGTMADLAPEEDSPTRQVPAAEAAALAAEWGTVYVETSAKTGFGIQAALFTAAEAAIRHGTPTRSTLPSRTADLERRGEAAADFQDDGPDLARRNSGCSLM
jgi:GTPase SAR1 family protein